MPTTAGVANTANDFYSLLASAVTAATGGNNHATSETRGLSNSGILIPPTVNGEERLNFIAAQRERLSILLSALDKEASNLQSSSSSSSATGMRLDGNFSSDDNLASKLASRKSEVDFENIEAESGAEDIGTATPRRTVKRGQSSSGGGSWMPWSWGANKAEEEKIGQVSVTGAEDVRGKSSGVDA